MIRLLAKAWAITSVLLAVWFGWLFVSVYWRNRSCFDENARCFVDGVVHHDAAFIYFWVALLSLFSAAAGVLCATRWRRPAP